VLLHNIFLHKYSHKRVIYNATVIIVFLLYVGIFIGLIFYFHEEGSKNLVEPLENDLVNVSLLSEHYELTFRPFSNTLEPYAFYYHPFENQKLEKMFKVQIEGTNLVNVYVVPSEENVRKFINKEEFGMYSECATNKLNGSFKCKATSGGILISNPTNLRNTYTVIFVSY